MNPSRVVLLGVCCAFTSCAKVSSVASRVKVPKVSAPNLKVPQFKKPSFAFLNPKKFSLKALRAGKRVPIVDVREKDLKKGKSGEQLYLAYNKKKKKYGYYSGRKGEVFTPVDFDPANLPSGDAGEFPTSGILPSLVPGGSSSFGTGTVDDLPPVDLPDIPDDLKMPEDFGVPGIPAPIDLAPPSLPKAKKGDPAPAFLESGPPPLIPDVPTEESDKEE